MERMNRTCLDMLAKLCEGSPDEWDQHLPFVTAAYNATPHASSGCSPNLLMFGRESTLPIDLIYKVPRPLRHPICPNAYVEWIRGEMEENFRFVREELGKAARRQKKDYDKDTYRKKFKEGDYVWRYHPPLHSHDKLNPKNIGPYKVVRHVGNGVYSLLRKEGDREINVHVNHLKRHFGKVDENDWPSEGGPFDDTSGSDGEESAELGNSDKGVRHTEHDDTRGASGMRRHRRMPPKYRDYDMS